jgi:hypothetical protein
MPDARDQRGCERGSRGRGYARDWLRRERDRGTAKASALFYAGRGGKRSGRGVIRMSEE